MMFLFPFQSPLDISFFPTECSGVKEMSVWTTNNVNKTLVPVKIMPSGKRTLFHLFK